MTLENPGLSRRKLLRTTAIGVPAAGLLAFGSTLVTATSANAIEVDGWWGSGTSAGVQRLMNAVFPEANLVVDGVISSQPESVYTLCPAVLDSGWEWEDDALAAGSPTIMYMGRWLTSRDDIAPDVKDDFRNNTLVSRDFIGLLRLHYGLPFDADEVKVIDNDVVRNMQNEINQWVG